MNYTKSEKRALRELSALAYERELSEALDELYKDFLKWKRKRIYAFDFKDYIHKFHNGISRKLWSIYADSRYDFAVIQAVAKGILTKEEVTDTLWPKIEQRVNIFRDR